MTPASTSMATAEAIEKINAYKKWYHGFEVLPGVRTQGEYQLPPLQEYLAEFGLASLANHRVLDLATFDGGFAFTFERWGAQVCAADLIDQSRTGFHVAHEVSNSRIEFRNLSVYDITKSGWEPFDAVHYSGLHYHLKHPQLALDQINAMLKMGGIVFGHGTSGEYHYRTSVRNRWIDSYLHRFLARLPVAYFLDGTFGGDPTNWFLFNDHCMKVMLQRAGFEVEICRSRVPHDFGHRTACYFKAKKVRQPDPEYWPDNHKQL